MHDKLRHNGWRVFVVESLADVLTILRDIEAGGEPGRFEAGVDMRWNQEGEF
jgi:hypothetical protein